MSKWWGEASLYRSTVVVLRRAGGFCSAVCSVHPNSKILKSMLPLLGQNSTPGPRQCKECQNIDGSLIHTDWTARNFCSCFFFPPEKNGQLVRGHTQWRVYIACTTSWRPCNNSSLWFEKYFLCLPPHLQIPPLSLDASQETAQHFPLEKEERRRRKKVGRKREVKHVHKFWYLAFVFDLK